MNRTIELSKARHKMNQHRKELARFKSDVELAKRVHGENYKDSTCYRLATNWMNREVNALHVAIREVESLLYIVKKHDIAK